MSGEAADPTWAAPPFPRAVRTYVGREAEVDRVLEWLDRETLFLVYGVAGIGKSEFVYKAIERVRATAQWKNAPALLLHVRQGSTIEHLVAQLRIGAGARSQIDIQSAAAARFEDDLAEAARVLDASPRLVFIDDLQHVDASKASKMLGYLARHVRESRIFVASRLEIPMPPGAPTPVVTRLQPLDEGKTATMVEQLTKRLGIELPDLGGVFRRSGGSPFYVQLELASPSGDGSVEDTSLDESLRELTPSSRRMLLLFSVLRGRFTTHELADSARDLTRAQQVVRDLTRRFLVDLSRDVVLVHDLIRDALARQADDVELADAHERAAALHLQRHLLDPNHRMLDAVEAVHHLVNARDDDQAWQVARSTYRAVAGAGFDHLFLEDLEVLRDAVDDREAVDLMIARILVRRSLIAGARDVLERGGDRGPAASLRYLLLSGEVAQRLGRLSEAEDLFRRASQIAERREERFHTALQLADVRSLRGRNEEARAVLLAAGRGLEPLSPRDRGRWGWSLALSYILEERFDEGAAEARSAAEDLARDSHDDIILLLGMLEVLARAQCDDVAGAREVMDAVVTRAAESGALREHVMSLYVGVVAYAAGELRSARVALESAYVHLEEHSDFVMASIAGYYFGRTLLAQGQVADAVSIFSEMAELAESAELYTLAPHGGASHADALLASGKIDEAREIARTVLESRELRADGRWIAQCVLARSYALEGELEEALEHHRTAIREAPADLHGAYAAAGKLERAALELMGGDPSVVIDSAQAAREHYGRVGRSWMEARSCVTLAAGLVARGGSADLVTAERPLARAEELTAEYTYPRVAARCALVRAALVRREGDSARAREHLVGALRGLDVRANRPEVAGLRAALQRADEGDMPPGVRAVISMLGLTSGPRYVIIDKAGTRAISEQEVTAERDNHDVVVEPARAVITVERGARSDRGRPMSCELLARLIEGRGAVVAAEDLFRDVWGGREYHPLRHRNTVYVAVRRLRQTLRKLLGEQDVIETASGGWRIADGVDAATIRPAD